MGPSIKKLFLGSVSLERNRWSEERLPSLRLSEWLPRIRSAGFDGIELWENHLLLSEAPEAARLCGSGLITCLNTYAPFDASPASREARWRASVAASQTGARMVKFNLGPCGGHLDEEIRRALLWAESFEHPVTLLCECHRGSLLETPDAAARAFAAWPADRFSAIVHPFTESPADLDAWFEALGPRIHHLHIQHAGTQGRRFDRLDRHPADLEQVARSLRAHRFVGTATIEFTEGAHEQGESPDRILDNAAADRAALLASLGAG